MSSSPSSPIPPPLDPEKEFAIWKGPHGIIRHIPYIYEDAFDWERRYWYPNLVHSTFSHYWYASLFIVVAYVAGIHALQRWMRDRPAYTLKWQLAAWNSFLAVFSMMATWRFGVEFRWVVTHRSFTDSVCLSINPSQPVAFWATLFALSKVAELFDSVFVVLRKRPLIFLHWYHHSVVLIYSWHAARELTAAGRWFMEMNFAVHSVMYTYYALTSMGFRLPRFLSMTVTTLQTAQMLVGVGISLYVARLKFTAPELKCQHSQENLLLCFFIYATFAILFIRFFISSYIIKGGKRAAKQHVKENGGSSNNGESSINGTANGNGSTTEDHPTTMNGHATTANGVTHRRLPRKAD